MRRFQLFWAVLLIFSAAMASYVVSLHVGERYDRVQNLQKQMRKDRDAIRMLETELTYRASPQRLQALIDAHGLPLGLPKADQYLVSAVDLAPQPGDPAPTQTPLLYAQAPVFVAPSVQTDAAPVQLASLDVPRGINGAGDTSVMARADAATHQKAGVAFGDMPLQHVTPPVADAEEMVPEKPRIEKPRVEKPHAVKPVVQKVAAPKPAIQKSTSPRTEKAVDAVAIKTTKPHPSTAILLAKPAPAKMQTPKIAIKEIASNDSVAKKTSTPKPATAIDSKPRRLDSALIASIESAAAKEAQTR
jgi:hypothetical protein